MQKVADFAEERNVDRNAVSQYIRRHGEEFKGHTKVDGHNLLFDDDAYVILDKKYPSPKPIMVVDGVPHEEYEAVQKKLELASERLFAAQEAIREKEKLLDQKEYAVQLLENKNILLEKTLEEKTSFMEKALEDEKAERISIQAENKALYARIEVLNAELFEAKRPKSLMEHIFGKFRANI